MKYRNQHPYYMLSKIYSRIKEFIISVIILIGALITKGKNEKIIFLVIALIAISIIVITIISWKKHIYSFDENGIHIKEGVINKKDRFIPVDKIQTIDMDSNITQRLFGVVTLKIDTAGGEKETEVHLDLSEKEAENIKEVLLNNHAEQRNSKEETKIEKIHDEDIKYKASIGDLIIAAVTSKYIGGGLVFILAICGKINDRMPKKFKGKLNDFENTSVQSIMDHKSIKLIIILILVVLIITFIISIINTVIKYHNFTIKRTHNKINITYGLFDKKSVIIPLYRIQSISIVEGILKKPFNAVTINIESIGYGKEKGESTILCPLLNKSKIDKFFKDVLIGIEPKFEFSYSSNKSTMGYLIRASIIPLIIIIFIAYKVKYGFFSLVILPFFILLGYYRQKNAAICIKENELIMQFRILAKHIVIIPKNNIQSSTKTQNIFQKRNDLINVEVAIQGESSEKQYTIKGMNNVEFAKLQQWLFNI